jgi:hypothetical protein
MSPTKNSMNYKVDSTNYLKHHDVPESWLTFKVPWPYLARNYPEYQEYMEVYRETLNMFPCLLRIPSEGFAIVVTIWRSSRSQYINPYQLGEKPKICKTAEEELQNRSNLFKSKNVNTYLDKRLLTYYFKVTT